MSRHFLLRTLAGFETLPTLHGGISGIGGVGMVGVPDNT
jgi:hypothetical protein